VIRRLGIWAALWATACTSEAAQPRVGVNAPARTDSVPLRATSAAEATASSAKVPSPHAPAEPDTSSKPHRPATDQHELLPKLDNALRKELGVEGARRFEFLRSLCPIALQRNQNRLLVGCRVCPPFDAAPPDGMALEVGLDESEFFELEGLTSGSFTRVGADEAAAVFSGCESAAENRGGTVLAERRPDGLWDSRAYKSGLHPNSCLAFKRPDRRDLLVCRWSYGHQGIGRHSLLVVDFADVSSPTADEGWRNLVTLDDDAASVCMEHGAKRSFPVDRWVTTGRIDGVELLAPIGDRPPGIVVRAHASRTKPTAAYLARCRDWLAEPAKANPRYIDVRPSLRPPALRLVFQWTGASLEPDVTTRAILQKLVSPPP
jgi:hypothetical protein